MLRITAAFLGLACLALAQDETTTFNVGHMPKYVNITFTSEMDLEVIVGSTNKATGEIKMGKGAGSVELAVPVDSMKTGIDMRDEHLRSEMWLDAKKCPTITFKSKKVEAAEDGKYKVTGDFTMHGVTKEITVVVAAKELSAEATKAAKFPEGKWAKFSTEFQVKLSDYGVKVPDMAATEVSDIWTVKISVYGGTAPLPEKKGK
jgi:polyisoprenoid-binding protein YceI